MKTLLRPFKKTCLLGAALCSFVFPSLVSAQFVDVTTEVGLSTSLEKSWGNPVWGDVNNDGFPDLIVPTHGLAASRGPFVYLNIGGTSFLNIRDTCGIGKAPALDSSDWHGYSFGDYDGDGNLDVYVAEGAKGNVGGTDKRDLLFRGNGNGTFANTSVSAGILVSKHRGRCSVWFDYNNDGLMDLFVKNYGDANDLYQNNGNGTFALVAGAAGLGDATFGKDSGGILALQDYDNDGLLDIAITGDGNAQSLYRRSSDGTFYDVTAAAGLASGPDAKGMAWGDYDNDGLPDLFIARGGLFVASTNGTLYHNKGDGTFTDATTISGLPAVGSNWAAVWGDYDNDGYLDLFIPSPGPKADGLSNANMLFHNNGNGTFTNVAVSEGIAMQDNVALHKGAAFADFNNDGFLDLIVKDGIGNESDTGAGATGVHTLFRDTPNGNHFLKINLRGAQSNRHGIGARVEVATSNGLNCYRQATGDAGGMYFSQSVLPVHFGIGAAASATITIKWPSGVTDTIADVAANSTITAIEGGASPTPTPTPTATPTPTPAPPVITKQPAGRRILVGQAAKFAVTATGNTLSYQWKKNDAYIAGAITNNYTTPPTTLADDGSNFSVVVSNPGGSVTSKHAQLGVTAPAKASPH